MVEIVALALLSTTSRLILLLSSKSRSALVQTCGQARHCNTRTPRHALMVIPLKRGLQQQLTEMPSTTFPTLSLTKHSTMLHISTSTKKSLGTKPGSLKSACREMLQGSAGMVSSLLQLQGCITVMHSGHLKRTVSSMSLETTLAQY